MWRVQYTIYGMKVLKKNRFLESEILNRNWKINLRTNFGISCKKLIATDYFDLEISILNNNLFVIRNFLSFSVSSVKYLELFMFVNALNKLCTKGFFIIDEEREVIIYSYNFQLESNQLNEDRQNLFVVKTVLDEIEILSKKLSFGIHQILFSDYEIDQIKECVLINTLGNA